VCDWVAAAAWVAFSAHISVHRGEYFLAVTRLGSHLSLEFNEATDEDGAYLKHPEFPEHQTILLAWHKAATRAEADEALGTLRGRLAAVPELKFLRRQPGRDLIDPGSPLPARVRRR
jgi:hypothetical protein